MRSSALSLVPTLSQRQKTRRQRYDEKRSTAQKCGASICTVNFGCEENLGYIIRAAACFGVETVHVIGSIPDRKFLSAMSGSLIDYVQIIQHSNPHDFLEQMRDQNVNLVAAELSESSVSIHDYEFKSGSTCLILGNEHTGVPGEILHHADTVHIPMPGVGFCLNTAQTGNIMLFEYNRQLSIRSQSEYLCAE